MWALGHCLEALLCVFQKSQNWIFGEFFYESLMKVSLKSRFSLNIYTIKVASMSDCYMQKYRRMLEFLKTAPFSFGSSKPLAYLDSEPNEGALEPPFWIFQKISKLDFFLIVSRLYFRVFSCVDCFRLVISEKISLILPLNAGSKG